MISSSKPRKQRKFRYTAPMHTRQNFVNAHISKELSTKLGLKRRSIELRKGDYVLVMAGDSKGTRGKVSEVNLKNGRITVEGVVRRNSKNKDIPIPLYASNVYITDLDLSDKLRKAEVEARSKK